jgi:GT2 family glycosyltransferase
MEMEREDMDVSIVIPTKNEGSVLEKCLNSIRNLDYPEDEIEVIIVDGHSTDETVGIAERYGCRVVYEDRGTISYARDHGWRSAKGKYIAFTDADCVVDKDWLKNLIKYFDDERIAAIGGPNITPDDDTMFAKCVGATLSFLSKPGARYGFKESKTMEIYHNPTCNVMYPKKVLEDVDGFNHALITVDDEELDYRIREKGYKILYTPDAIVYHYRRPTWTRFAKMAYNYGVGRMQAIKMHREMGRWFHYAPSMLIFMASALIALSVMNEMLLHFIMIILLSILGLFIFSLHFNIENKQRCYFTMPTLMVTWLLFWGVGFFRGVFK